MISKETEEVYLKTLEYIEKSGINYKDITNISEYISCLKLRTRVDGLPISASSVKLCLVATVWYLKCCNGDKNHLDALRKEIDVLSREHDAKVKQNILIGTQELNYLDWTEVLEIYENLKLIYKKSRRNHMNFVLLSCYVLLCPRRLKDYALMIVVDDNNNLNIDYNYYVRNSGCFVFNNYKTKKIYKTQCIQLSDELCMVLNEYIDKYKINGSLFNLTKKAILMKLTRLFVKAIDKNVSVNILRHSYITWAKDTGLMNGNEHLISQLMAHSVLTQIDYYKNPDKKVLYNNPANLKMI